MNQNHHRFTEIDFARSFFIVTVILIHVLGELTNYTTMWNWLHFAVTGLVFTSGYTLAKTKTRINNLKQYKAFVVKRFKRLVFPWWIFLTIYFSLALVSSYIQNKIIAFSIIDVLNSYLFFGFSGGLGWGWLIWLMLSLSLIFPLTKMNWVSGTVLFVLLNFIGVALQVKWLWGLGLGLAFFFGVKAINFKKKQFLGLGLISLILFFILSPTFDLFALKNPPSLYYLLFGFGVTGIVFYVGKKLPRILFMEKLSKKSLQIYLYSYPIIGVIKKFL